MGTNSEAVTDPADDDRMTDTAGDTENGEGTGGAPSPSQPKSSISEAAQTSPGLLNPPGWLQFLELPFRVAPPAGTGDVKLDEATGWAMDAAGRGPLVIVGSFVGSVIVSLAAEEAGCDDPDDCDETVHGLKPSSLLTLNSSVFGVFTALLMPVVGAMVDHTRYRHEMGMISGFLAVALVGVQISLSPDTWLFNLIVDGVQGFFVMVHVTAVFAYLPDLSLDPDVLSHYTSRFNFRQFASQLAYLLIVIVLSRIRGTDTGDNDDDEEDGGRLGNVQTGKDCAMVALIFGGAFIGYSWLFLFRKRPALSKVPEGSNLLTTGFIQVRRTAGKIYREYNALKWLMISDMLSPEAGAGVVQAISSTYFTVVLDLDAVSIVQLNLIGLVCGLPGALLSKPVCLWINPLNSYRLALTLIALSVAASIVVLDGPGKFDEARIFSALWGLLMGWVVPSKRVLSCTLIPRAQETEMMGMFIFAGQILGWLPPMLFTLINENDVNLQWGMALIPMFTAAAVLLTLPMGSYSVASEFVLRDSEAKYDSVLASVRLQGGTTDTSSEIDDGNAKEMVMNGDGLNNSGEEEPSR